MANSAAEVADEPEDRRETEAQEEAGDDGEVEAGVVSAADDVTGEAEGEFAAARRPRRGWRQREERIDVEPNDAGGRASVSS